jgi:septal ring factor EnvC (AmiA/AmiB activator)
MNDDTRLALLEQTINHIDTTLCEIKSDIKIFKQEISQKYDKIENQFQRIENRFQRLEDKVDDKFKWTMGVMITLFSGLYATALGGMIARMCHWI